MTANNIDIIGQRLWFIENYNIHHIVIVNYFYDNLMKKIVFEYLTAIDDILIVPVIKQTAIYGSVEDIMFNFVFSKTKEEAIIKLAKIFTTYSTVVDEQDNFCTELNVKLHFSTLKDFIACVTNQFPEKFI